MWEKIIATHRTDNGLSFRMCKEFLQIHKKDITWFKQEGEVVRDLKSYFAEGDVKNVSTHLKRCSMSRIIRKMQIETPGRYRCRTTRISKINQNGHTKYEEMGKPSTSGRTTLENLALSVLTEQIQILWRSKSTLNRYICEAGDLPKDVHHSIIS